MASPISPRAIASFLILTVAACGCSGGDTGEQLVGAWDLEALAVDARVVSFHADLAASQIVFGDDGRFRGRAPCNDFSGTWSLDGRLVLGEVIMSAAACADPDGGDSIMEAEEVLFSALFESGPFDVRREGAELEMRTDDVVLGWTSSGP